MPTTTSVNHRIAQKLSESAEWHMREAARLYGFALPFEERAAAEIPSDKPRTKKILATSAEAIKYKAETLRSMFK